MAARKSKYSKGDVFTIPLIQDKVGWGQIFELDSKYSVYCVFFEYVSSSTLNGDIEQALSSPILLIGWTPSNQFTEKNRPVEQFWTIRGNYESQMPEVVFPVHKVGSGGVNYVVSHLGEKIRVATDEELDLLYNQSSRSSAGFRNLLISFLIDKAPLETDPKYRYDNLVGIRRRVNV